MALLVPTQLEPGTTRSWIPLDLDLSAAAGRPPSHGLNLARTVCHPITPDRPLEPHEIAAITHFATCPARPPRASTPTEGPR